MGGCGFFLSGDGVLGGDVGAADPQDAAVDADVGSAGVGDIVGVAEVSSDGVAGVVAASSDVAGGAREAKVVVEGQFVHPGASLCSRKSLLLVIVGILVVAFCIFCCA